MYMNYCIFVGGELYAYRNDLLKKYRFFVLVGYVVIQYYVQVIVILMIFQGKVV